jgi:tetratricopeptide (TPR) repeat protein
VRKEVVEKSDPDGIRDRQIASSEQWRALGYLTSLKIDLAMHELKDGETDRAEELLREAVPMTQLMGDLRLEYLASWGLAGVSLDRRDHVQARTYLLAALGTASQAEWLRLEEGNILKRLGLLELELGRLYGARTYLGGAREIYTECEARADEAECLLQLGDIELKFQRPLVAQGHYAAARQLIRRYGTRFQEVKMMRRLADLATSLGSWDVAQARYRSTLVALDDLGEVHPEDEIRSEREAALAKLASLAISRTDRLDEEWTIESPGEPSNVLQLRQISDIGLVIDVKLEDGSTVSGVLIGVSESDLILEAWDAELGMPSGDPVTVSIDNAVRIVVP